MKLTLISSCLLSTCVSLGFSLSGFLVKSLKLADCGLFFSILSLGLYFWAWKVKR